MLPHRRQPQTAARNEGTPLDRFHEWLLSVPWVAERPSLATPGVRCFGVDCPPLGRRELCLMTGLPRHVDVDGIGMAVIVTAHAAYDLESGGRGLIVAPMPRGRALVTVHGEALSGRQELEALALTAYDCAMS
jgi:hypothetical protein